MEYINKINSFIEKNDNTIVFSHYANIFNILNKKCYGDFDLPFKGNLGKNGEEGLIYKLKELKNTYVIILDQDKEDLFWQESKKANEYVKENYEFVEGIDKFLIYKTKE